MISPKGRLIQKRNKKKERYAKVSRKRKRTLSKTPSAQVAPLETRYSDDEPNIYHFQMNIIAEEKDDQLQYDFSMYNKTHFANSVSVSYEGGRFATIKLQGKSPKPQQSNDISNTLQYEEDKESKSELEGLREFMEGVEEVFKKNAEQTGNKSSELCKNKYKNYLTIREQLLRTRACGEVKKLFSGQGPPLIEILYTSKFLDLLGYGFVEFVEIVLKSGLPHMNYEMTMNGRKFEYSSVLPELLSSFDQTQYLTNIESLQITKDQNLKKFNFIIVLNGSFIKNAAEFSAIISVDEIDPVPRPLSSNISFTIIYNKLQTLNIKERRQFLQKFYPKEYFQMIENSKKIALTSPLLARKDSQYERESVQTKSTEIRLEATSQSRREQYDDISHYFNKNGEYETSYNIQVAASPSIHQAYPAVMRALYQYDQ